MMKKIPIIAAILMLCLSSYGQEINSDSTKLTYCEIVGTEKLLSKKVTVSIDFGQETKLFTDRRYKDPATGKPYTFNSMVDALNFMGNNGWKFVQAYALGDAQSGYIYHFLMKKRPDQSGGSIPSDKPE